MSNSNKLTLFVSLRSPFARRVRVALTRVGISFEEEVIDVFNPPAHFLALNSLGMVPTLVGPGGFVLSDSSMILEWAQSMTGAIYPRGLLEWEVRQASVLAEGVIQSLVLYFQETALHEAPSPYWVNEHFGVIKETLKVLEGLPRGLLISSTGAGTSELTQAGWDLVVALEYMTLRLPGYDWQKLHPSFENLVKAAHHLPKFAQTVPPAAI